MEAKNESNKSIPQTTGEIEQQIIAETIRHHLDRARLIGRTEAYREIQDATRAAAAIGDVVLCSADGFSYGDTVYRVVAVITPDPGRNVAPRYRVLEHTLRSDAAERWVTNVCVIKAREPGAEIESTTDPYASWTPEQVRAQLGVRDIQAARLKSERDNLLKTLARESKRADEAERRMIQAVNERDEARGNVTDAAAALAPAHEPSS
jgi:hypothetical protein